MQVAYFMLAARSLGLDCGPMSGFDNAKVDAAFFAGTTVKSNFLCNLGYGDATKLFPRNPPLRLWRSVSDRSSRFCKSSGAVSGTLFGPSKSGSSRNELPIN